MKNLDSIFFILAITTFISAQSSDLPERLIPSDQAKQEAIRLRGEAVKMLPRFLLDKKMEPRPDSEAVLGIRGNRAFYSFSTRTHSYNNLPEIMLASGELLVIPTAPRFGIMAYLGTTPIDKLTATSEIPELKILAAYKPPNPEEHVLDIKIRAERTRAGVRVSDGYPVILGHTYALRAITSDKADVLVTFTVFRIEKDGSIELIWKILDQRMRPTKLYLSDTDLRLAVQQVIEKNQIFKTVSFEVKDNEITLSGHTTRIEFDKFVTAIERLRVRGLHLNLIEDK